MEVKPAPAFLNGALQIEQAQGYRAGMDAVLLAASITAKPGASLLELGCGAGTALLCAAHHNQGCTFTGLEKQTKLAALARENTLRNQMQDQVQISNGCVGDLPRPFAPDSFDAVFFNPPYQDDPASGNLPSAGRDTAFVTDAADLRIWVKKAVQMSRARGIICVIHRADRMADLIAYLHGSCGDIRILPIASHAGKKANRVLVRARKGVATPATICPPLILHEVQRHHTKEAEAILRGEKPLSF